MAVDDNLSQVKELECRHGTSNKMPSLQSHNLRHQCYRTDPVAVVTRARRTASADWWITPGTAGMRPRDLFTTSRDYRESVGKQDDTENIFYAVILESDSQERVPIRPVLLLRPHMALRRCEIFESVGGIKGAR
ncbi:hypothetical protein EVAR_50390_1 [Eumeta japonica]|uniref:Uncharacterized protein n=1 Tax=Eumeta variegata TaxID=151549 RepID=A0A4C1WTU5_EUMVA|nr:hypothetical protein EVAR_50390_1 [Eumeta japonica]